MPETVNFDEVPQYDIVRKVSAKGMDILQHKTVFTYDDMVFLTAHASYGDDWRRTNLERLHRARMVSDMMVREDASARPYTPIDALHPKEVEMWRAEMIDEFSTALKFYAEQAGHWMPLFGYLFPTASVSYRALNESWYLKQLVIPGRICIIDGDLGTGKSAHAFRMTEVAVRLWLDYVRASKEGHPEDSDLWVMSHELYGDAGERGSEQSAAYDLLHSSGPRFISNMEVPRVHANPNTRTEEPYPYYDYYQFSTRLTEVNIHLFNNAKSRSSDDVEWVNREARIFKNGAWTGRVNGYFSFLWLDEMGISFNRKRNMSRQNFGLEGMFRLIRKPSAVLGVITQNKELDLPDHMRRPDKGAKTVIEKLTKKTAIITVHGVGQLHHQRVHDVPNTTVPFETRGMASMAVDHDPRQLIEEVEAMRSVSKLKDGRDWSMDDQWDAMIEWCEAKQSGTGMNEYKRNKVLALLQSEDPETGALYTPEDVAEEEGVSIEFVQECQGVTAVVAEHPHPESGVLDERIRALFRLKYSAEECARIGGCSLEFVKSVKEKSDRERKEGKTAPAPSSAPASPSSPSLAPASDVSPSARVEPTSPPTSFPSPSDHSSVRGLSDDPDVD